MTILIVEDDPALAELLTHLVATAIPLVEIRVVDNLDDAVAAIEACSELAILSDGTFPAWPKNKIALEWNQPKPNWIGLAGWAEKKHLPLIVLTGSEGVAQQARRAGVPVFLKPFETHAAIACLRCLVLPASVRENPAVEEQDLINRRVRAKSRETA